MNKKYVNRSNSKQHLFGTKFDMHVKNIKNIQFNNYIFKINSYIKFFFFFWLVKVIAKVCSQNLIQNARVLVIKIIKKKKKKIARAFRCKSDDYVASL